MNERGYAMAALLVAISVIAVFLSQAMPSWYTMAKREREAELVFRGQQYARAVTLFQRKLAGAYPPNIETLVKQKFLRKQYKDPMTNGDFQIVAVGDAIALQGAADPRQLQTPGAPPPPGGRGGPPLAAQQPGPRGTGGVPGAGIQGVVSKSKEESLRLFNGRQHYNEWVFIGAAATTAAGAGGQQGAAGQVPGMPPGGVGPVGVPGRGGQGGQGGRGGPPDGRGRGIQPPGFPPGGGRPGFPPGAPPGGGPGGQQQGFPFPGGARGRF